MASLRKKFSRWSLGEQQSRLSNDYESTDGQDPLYQSPRRLHKALSTTFNYMANTVRRGTMYIYQEKDGSPQHSMTPSKHGRRSSLFASVSSRKGFFSPREQGGEDRSLERIPVRTSESSEVALTPVRSRPSSQCSTLVSVKDGKAPTLDVKIPDSSWSVGTITGMRSTSIITALQSPLPSEDSDNGLFMQDPFIDRDDMASPVHDFMAPELPRLRSYGKPLYVEDTGYIAESESGSEPSEADEHSSARLKGVGLGPPETETSKPCNYTHLASLVQTPHQSESPKTHPSRGSSAVIMKPARRSSLGVVQPQQSQIQGSRPLPSDVYEADAELSETSSEIAPSMGSPTNFKHGLADRGRRYLAAIGQSSDSDRDKSLDSQLPTSATMPAFQPVENQQVTSSSPSETPKAQLPSLMLSMSLTEDDLMALGRDNIEGQDVLQVVSTSDTDFSDCSPFTKGLLTQEDAYGAGMKAAGILRPSYSRELSPTSWKHSGLDRSSPQPDTPTFTSKGVRRASSSLSDATSDSCAITTRSPACNVSPPFPTLHTRSEPTPQCVADASVLNTTENEEIPISGPANLGFHPLPPVDLGDQVPADSSVTAELPNFGSPSTGVGPKSKRALRRQKKTNKRAAFTGPAQCDTMKRTSFAKEDQPQFSVQQFLSSHGKPSTYVGHELEAIHNDAHRAGNSPQGREVKVVSFAEKEEIIGRSVIVRRLSPGRSPQ